MEVEYYSTSRMWKWTKEDCGLIVKRCVKQRCVVGSSLTRVYFRTRWPPRLEISFKYETRYDSVPVIVVISLCQSPSVVESSRQGQYLHLAVRCTDEHGLSTTHESGAMNPPLLSQHRRHMEVNNIIIRMKDSNIFVDKASTRRRAAAPAGKCLFVGCVNRHNGGKAARPLSNYICLWL